jgi:hypothetical protein
MFCTSPLAFGNLTQTEKEITASKPEQIHKITTIFSRHGHLNRVNSCQFVNFLSIVLRMAIFD